MPYPRAPRKLPIVLTQEEAIPLIDSASNLFHRAMLMTLYSTGMRRPELCHLKVEDIDSTRMSIHIRHGKRNRDRDVPLSPKLLETLREYWRWMQPKAYLFPGTVKNWRADKPITPKVLWEACREAAQTAGIAKDVRPHLPRHSFATHLLENGADLPTVQDHQRWIRPRYAFFLPMKVLSRVFRGKFTAGLKRALRKGELTFPGGLQPLAQEAAVRSFLRSRFCQDWVLYANPPFGGPQRVLHYLARYTHRVAISNHRLVNFADDQVTFRWKDYAHGSKRKLMMVTAEEFLRRFLLHVLPHGFVRIRFFGFLSTRCRKSLLPLCHQLLQMPASGSPSSTQPKTCSRAVWLCPRYGEPMVLVKRFTADELNSQSVERRVHIDSS